ncbi:MAG: hypothetical protein WKF61_12780 [Luteimonas sp.]
MSTRSINAREAASAANRFGMGARPGELAQLREPRDWLLAQLHDDEATAVFAAVGWVGLINPAFRAIARLMGQPALSR